MEANHSATRVLIIFVGQGASRRYRSSGPTYVQYRRRHVLAKLRPVQVLTRDELDPDYLHDLCVEGPLLESRFSDFVCVGILLYGNHTACVNTIFK